ncbi:MAG: type II toxin-antitoxin system RelE/ParE family toxin [Chloroflexi bacterium]|nr:type II toxin-antitoxin system RelE/ParE family toxin [Chloroflexota bacterium]
MARAIRYHDQFRQDLDGRVRWLVRNRPPEQRVSLQRELRSFIRRVAAFPGLGEEVERRGTISYRVGLLGEPLPYLVWYSYDDGDPDGAVSLLMLLHEAQDRLRFDPRDLDDQA